MSKNKLVMGVVALAVAAGLAWYFTGNKEANPIGVATNAVEQVVNPRAALEAKSAELVKNFEAYLVGTEQAGTYKWESVTTLDDGTARLNNMTYKAANMGDERAVKFKTFDLQKMTYTPELYEQKVVFTGLANHEGKSLIQEALSEDNTYADVGYTGDLALTDGSFDLIHDVKNDTASLSVQLKQADFLNIGIDFSGDKLNNLSDTLKKTSEEKMAEDPMILAGALSPVLINKFAIHLDDTGFLARLSKAEGAQKMTKEECQFAVMMAGVPFEETSCDAVVKFINGEQAHLSLSINPAQPFAMSKVMAVAANEDMAAVIELLKELNIKVSN